jgi:hypothetical protein
MDLVDAGVVIRKDKVRCPYAHVVGDHLHALLAGLVEVARGAWRREVGEGNTAKIAVE